MVFTEDVGKFTKDVVRFTKKRSGCKKDPLSSVERSQSLMSFLWYLIESKYNGSVFLLSL